MDGFSLRVLDLDMDGNTLSNTLRDDAEVLELRKAAIEVFDTAGLGAKLNRHVDAGDAKPALLIANDPRSRFGGKRTGVLFEFSHRKEQARGQAIRYRRRDEPSGIGAFVLAAGESNTTRNL